MGFGTRQLPCGGDGAGDRTRDAHLGLDRVHGRGSPHVLGAPRAALAQLSLQGARRGGPGRALPPPPPHQEQDPGQGLAPALGVNMRPEITQFLWSDPDFRAWS